MSKAQPRNKRGKTGRSQVMDLAKRQGVVRPRDLQALGIQRMVLTRLKDEGLLERVGWGLYRLASAEPMGEPDVVLVTARAPQAVIGLVTALHQHGLTTEIPKVVDILLPRGKSPPSLDYPPLRIFWSSGPSFTGGIEELKLDQVTVRMTNPAKSVADCFKFRRRVGVDVALEALKSGLASRKFTPSEFARYAKINRVMTLTKPYLDSLL